MTSEQISKWIKEIDRKKFDIQKREEWKVISPDEADAERREIQEKQDFLSTWDYCRSYLHEIAVKHCPDYPGIETATPSIQLWAVDTSMEGRKYANEDNLKLVEKLRKELGISAEEMISRFVDGNEG